jgi:LysM repeat protein
MFDFMQRDAPNYYFAKMPWLLLPSPGCQQDAWYGDFWQRAFKEGTRANVALPTFPVPGVQVGANLPVVLAVKAMTNLQRGAHQPARPAPVSIPPKPPPPPPPPSAEKAYLVQHGDTLTAIAKRFETTVPALTELNQIADPNRIFAGQRLVIPPAPTVEPPPVPPIERPSPAETAPSPEPPPEVAPPPTLPKPSATIPTPPKPRSGDQFDPRLAALNVRVLNAMVSAGYTYWRLVRAEYQDPTQSGNNHHVYYSAFDENGAPIVGQRVFQGWPDDQAETTTDGSGNANIAMWASYSPDRGESGPYSAWVDGLPSDRVTGLGLPLNRHVNFRLTWQKTVR